MDPNLLNPNDPSVPTPNVVVPESASQVVPPPAQVIPSIPLTPPPVYSQEPQVQQAQTPIQNTLPPVPVANPVSQNEPSAPPPDTNFEGVPKKQRINKKVAAIAVALFFVAVIPLTVFVANQKQNTQSGATQTNLLTSNPVVAVFNRKNIKVNDLLTTATAQGYSESDLNGAGVLSSIRDVWVERQILDIAQKAEGIDVNSSEFQTEVSQLQATQDLSQQEAYYAVLKNKITLKDVNSVAAVSIGFWFTPQQGLTADNGLNTAAISSTDNQINLSLQALAEIRTDLNAGQDPVAVINSITSNPKYASIKDLVGLNGNLVSTITGDLSSYAAPQILEYGSSNLDTNASNKLFSTNPPVAVGQVLISEQTDTNSSGYVYKIVAKGNSNGPVTYDAWFAQQLKSLVSYPSPDPL